MIKLGVPDFAAHKFIFYTLYYPEVSPPTALSPFAARSDNRRQSLQHYDDGLEIHAPRIPGSVHLHCES